MSVDEPFDWDEANIAHLARHGITPAEFEETVHSQPVTLTTELRGGELRRRELGETARGIVLIVVTVARGYKIGAVTGWQADKSLRNLWQALQRRRIP